MRFTPTPEQQNALSNEGIKGQFILQYDVDRTSLHSQMLVSTKTVILNMGIKFSNLFHIQYIGPESEMKIPIRKVTSMEMGERKILTTNRLAK